MEEILTAVRTSVCKNCGQKVTLHMSDLRIEPYGWSHDESGERHCPDAPMAEPEYVDDLSGLQQMIQDRVLAHHKRLADLNAKLR